LVVKPFDRSKSHSMILLAWSGERKPACLIGRP
jgi:hypothetical protein